MLRKFTEFYKGLLRSSNMVPSRPQVHHKNKTDSHSKRKSKSDWLSSVYCSCRKVKQLALSAVRVCYWMTQTVLAFCPFVAQISTCIASDIQPLNIKVQFKYRSCVSNVPNTHVPKQSIGSCHILTIHVIVGHDLPNCKLSFFAPDDLTFQCLSSQKTYCKQDISTNAIKHRNAQSKSNNASQSYELPCLVI